MSAKKIRWVRAIVNGEERLLELDTIKANSLDIDVQPLCPCCHVPLKALLDITQYGFIEDKFIVLFSCAPCGKAFWYNYTLSMMELSGESHDTSQRI